MANVIFYKSKVTLAGVTYPVSPGGGTLNWTSGYSIPALVGNWYQMVKREGFQAPTIDLSLDPLGQNTNGVISAGFLNKFITRVTDSAYRGQHDIADAGVFTFYDGNNGFTFTKSKPNQFSIGGSKGEGLTLSTNWHIYGSSTLATPAADIAAADTPATMTPFTGVPIRFQDCKFLIVRNGGAPAPLEGLISWNLTYSNNCTPDMSFGAGYTLDTSLGYQNPFPEDVNAGMATCGARFTFYANAEASSGTLFTGGNHINTDDTISIKIINHKTSTAYVTTLALGPLVVENTKVRSISTGRQVRTYNCTVLTSGASNAVYPVTITDSTT